MADRLLFLCHRYPSPPDKGDRIRSHHELRFLAARRPVMLACPWDEPPSDGLPQLAERALVPLGRRRAMARAGLALLTARPLSVAYFHLPRLQRAVDRMLARAGMALCFSSAMAAYLQGRGLPYVLDMVDLDSEKWRQYARICRPPWRWIYALEAARLLRFEREVAGGARAVLLCTEAEAALFRQRCGEGFAVRVMQNGVDLERFRPLGERFPRPVLMFTGALDYYANVDGLGWFCREVLPRVRRRVEGAELWLVGRNPTPGVRRLARQEGVRLVGRVPEVPPLLGRAWAAVVPLRVARGVQNKVLEAMACGLPVVATPAAMEGIGAEPDRDLLVADDPEGFAAHLIELLTVEGLRRALGEAARAYVERHHRWEDQLRVLQEVLG